MQETRFNPVRPTGVPPEPCEDQLALLQSDDPELARNKRLVFDFWRIVYEGGHLDRAAEFMADEYIQHNPNLPSGRQTFVDFFKQVREPGEIADRIRQPLIAVVAEGDKVTLSFVRKVDNPTCEGEVYYMTWFDMFRIENGRIAEHWDSSPLWTEGKPPGARYLPR
ncbi:MAG: nuclear transport factor 2 family protein [Spongiibacteraceae bacterium]|jgi:predicted SnoaL-like aldol condensation-catalyzing enzyme|nr:nuclear transport factor 2 family protein [Spongiibacteraceae bacterium]